METGERVWQASDARTNLPAVMDAALSGAPQVIRRRSGEEVVVVSRADYDRMRPSLKNFLLHGGVEDSEEDDFDKALSQVRGTGALGFAPRSEG